MSTKKRLHTWAFRWLEGFSDYDYDNDPRLLAEDENGDLWVPSRSRSGWWDRRVDLRNPAHWPAYLRSRRRNSLVMINTSG